MKTILATLITLSSLVVMADIPRPNPVNPAPAKSVDADAIGVLVYGAPVAKITALKTGGNTMKVSQQVVRPGVVRYTYTSQQCTYGIAGNMCLGGKQMSVTRTEIVSPDRQQVSYEASDVLSIK
ncbi:MAG: hypothetical protein ACXWQQ_05045 [Pseudobdellovibrio sp.]